MNYITARCGHQVIAEGAEGSSARKACEDRTCGSARCKSGLPKKFTDEECEAFVYMTDLMIGEWSVDLLRKTVSKFKGEFEVFNDLIEFANEYGFQESRNA